MIVAIALCPAPPLLVSDLTGAGEVLPELRGACRAAVAELLASVPDVVVVVGAGEATQTWNPGGRLDLAVFAPGVATAAPGSEPAGSPDLPAALGIGAWLLTEAGYRGERILQSVGCDEPVTGCVGAGAVLAAGPRRVALLVMADGSARRGLKAPGYLDERSAGFDAEVERAIRGADLDALLAIDAGLAGELMATGRPAWQALAGALRGCQVSAEVRYCDDPFGVAYLVASLRPIAER